MKVFSSFIFSVLALSATVAVCSSGADVPKTGAKSTSIPVVKELFFTHDSGGIPQSVVSFGFTPAKPETVLRLDAQGFSKLLELLNPTEAFKKLQERMKHDQEEKNKQDLFK